MRADIIPGDLVALACDRIRVDIIHLTDSIASLAYSTGVIERADVAVVVAVPGIHLLIPTSQGTLGWCHINDMRRLR